MIVIGEYLESLRDYCINIRHFMFTCTRLYFILHLGLSSHLPYSRLIILLESPKDDSVYQHMCIFVLVDEC